jgi:prophage regulatory protein
MQSQTTTDTSQPQPSPERHIMRRDEVERKTGFKRAHIYNLMKEGKFPRLSASACARSVGTRWRLSGG